MSSKKRREETKKLKEQIPTSTLKELMDRGELPEGFHLFSRQEMEEYNRKKNKERREAFRKRLEKYEFVNEDEWW